MKKIAFLLCVLTVFAFAQNPVYSEPAFPTEDDSIVVYFDATKGNQTLQDYTGDLYAHTGVIIEGEDDWQHVWTNWPSTNIEKNKLIRISSNLYKIVIGYPHEYYSCPSTEKNTPVGFCFQDQHSR